MLSTSLSTSHRALVALLLAAGTTAALADDLPPPPVEAGPALSRAEVRADLAVWRQAGFTGNEVDLNGGPEQDRRLAEYQRLRNGPAFAAALQQQEQRDAERATRTAAHGSGTSDTP